MQAAAPGNGGAAAREPFCAALRRYCRLLRRPDLLLLVAVFTAYLVLSSANGQMPLLFSQARPPATIVQGCSSTSL